MFTNLRNRLTVIFISLAVIPTIIAGVILASLSFSSLEQQSIDIQHNNARLIAQTVSAYIVNHEDELQIIGNIRGLRSMNHEEQAMLLESFFAQNHDYQELALLDQSGAELIRLSRTEAIRAENLNNRAMLDEYLIPAETHMTYYSPITFDEIIFEPLMTLSIPIEDLQTGDAIFILVVDLRFRTIGDVIAEFPLEGGEDIYVLNADGQIIAHRNPSVVLSKTIYTVENEGNAIGLNGSDVILATDEIRFGDQVFVVVAEQPYLEASALAINLLNINSSIVVVSLIVSVIIGVVVVRQIVIPIEMLSETAKQISNGDLTKRVKIRSKDEIGALGEAFNIMTSRLGELIDSLEEHVMVLEAAELEQKRLVEQLREASSVKDEFLAVMSHELRTPLNAIIGYSGIMKLNQTGENKKILRMLDRIKANSNRLLRLIDDILDISRIESGRMDIVYDTLSLQELIEGLEEATSIFAKEKNLLFTVTIDPLLPDLILMDEDVIIKILNNLLSNAVKFTEEGEVELRLSKDGNMMVITVMDTGIGIPVHMHSIIFERFRQVDSSTTRVYGGTGLGLAIVERLCTALGGNVQVESELGEGSTFTVTIPLKIAGISTRQLEAS